MYAVNEPIDLFTGRLTVSDGKSTYRTRGRIWLAWTPVPRIRFAFDLSGSALGSHELTIAFALNRRRASAPARVTSESIAMSAGGVDSRIEGFFTREVSIGAGRGLASIHFHLPNVPRLDGTLSVTVGDWLLTIASTIPTSDFDMLREGGGYAMTAEGVLERSSGRPFDASAVREMMQSLSNFLSFAIGRWTEPMLVTGHDAAGAEVWHQWSAFRLSGWEARPSWLPQRHHQQAMELFNSWHMRWNDPYWREVLGRTTYFYVDANRQYVDLGLVIGQAALETLSYAISVNTIKSIAATAYNARSYTAAAKIRGLLRDVGLSAAVPPELPALLAFSGAGGADGPSKVTYLRNRLVHPLKTVSAPVSEETIDAWRLALWYIEASLLSLLDYKGSARSRVSLSEVSVP